jgi:glyoxylase-like metal-dependent hydrolase (beta-lactamase superfamily II)
VYLFAGLMRMRTAAIMAVLALAAIRPVPAQENSPPDLTGSWRWVNHEDERDRNPGAFPGDYRGLPLNDAARFRADTYDEEINSTSSLLQCRPRTPGYQPKGLDPMRIDKVTDPLTRQFIAYRISYEKTPGERVVWLDGRPSPSQYALHSWDGFSTGKFRGDTLEITTTHIKESYVRRNGVATSFRATVIEQMSLEEPYLEVTFTVIDPDYLTEPLVRSATYMRAPTLQLPPYPCQPEDNQLGEKYRVPNYLPGENPYLTESAFKYKVPEEASRGGADTLYPEWRAKGVTLRPPAAQSTLKPTYTDASTKIAERADAAPRRAPAYDKVEALHVAGNVYLIAGAGGNIAVSAGGDGMVMVDSGAAAATDNVLAAVRQINATLRPPDPPESASAFGNQYLATHAPGEPAIRLIINTSANADHVGGNANIRMSPYFRLLGYRDPTLSLQVLAHANVQSRMVDAKAPDMLVPTDTYLSDRYTLYRFFNNQAVQLFHFPKAVTDGDSIVWFRRSDVIAAGDIYNSDVYPPIDVDKGGSIDGEIEALDKLIEMSVTEFMAQGGTLIVPGRGWISDAADVGYYRDMLMVVRDRIKSMADKNMTLAQVKAAKPTMDFDPEYGREPGVTSRFVEAVYRSLKEKK